MFSRINFLKIIKDHFQTLRRIDKKALGPTFWDLILFVIAPLIFSLFLVFHKVSIKTHISDLITIVSIIGGFLLNLLAIVYGLMDKLTIDSNSDKKKSVFVNEVHVNISFNILLSIFLILFLLTFSFVQNLQICEKLTYLKVLDSIVLFLLGMFILTMLMVLNRIYIIMKKN